MTSQHTMVIGLAAVVVLAGISFASYQVGYDRGRGADGLSQTQSGEVAPTTVNTVLGTVENISDQEITLKDAKRIPETSAAQSGTVTVTVGGSTVIERLVQKDTETLNKEMAAFVEDSKKLQEQGAATTATPPEPFTREKIALNDINIGDVLVAHSAQDLSQLTAFTATKIEVQDMPKPTVPVATSTPVSAQTDTTTLPPPPIPADARKAQ